MDINKLTIEKKLGSGMAGAVFLAIYRDCLI